MQGLDVGEPTIEFHSRGRLLAVTDRRWMEQLMVRGARFRVDEFKRLFLGERRRLASELLWARYSGTKASYFVIDSSTELSETSDDEIGIPYTTEIGPATRNAAARLLGVQSIEQLNRPIIQGGLSTLDDASLWTGDTRGALRSRGFGIADDVARGALSRRYHHGRDSVVMMLVPRNGTRCYDAYSSVGTRAIPTAILNEFLLEVGRALIPGQEFGFPFSERLATAAPCALCSELIAPAEYAVMYQRADRSRNRVVAIHRSCQLFSLPGQLLRAE